MKKSTLLFFILLSSLIMKAQCPTDFYKGYGSNGQSEGGSVVVDGTGNVYTVGKFVSSIQLGAFSLTAPNGVYLAKHDPAGNITWAIKLYEAGSIFLPKIMLDLTGEIVVAGTCDNPNSSFGNISNAFNNGYIYLAKINPSTGLVDYFYASGNQYTFVQNFTIDNNNNIYLTGGFVGVFTCGSTTLSCTGTTNTFLIKFNASNSILWAKRVTNNINSGNVGNAVETDPTGNIYLAGWFGYHCDFGNGITLTSTAFPGYFAKYDTSGNILWARQSRAGGIYNGLLITDTSTIHLFYLNTSSYKNSVVRCNQNGDSLWTKETNFLPKYFVAGKYLTSGYFKDSLILDSISYTSPGYNIFIAKLDSNMVHHEMEIITGTSTQYPGDFTIDNQNNFYVSGSYYNNDTVEGHPLSNYPGNLNILLAKFCSSFTSLFESKYNNADPSIYPNPLNSTVTIRIQKPNIKHVLIRIKNIIGQTILTVTENNNHYYYSKTLDLSFLPSGIYLLEIIADGKQIVRKIVKE